MAVQPLLQPLLVKEMPNKTHGATQHEQRVKRAIPDRLVSLLLAAGHAHTSRVRQGTHAARAAAAASNTPERSARAQEVDHGARNYAVHIEDQVWLLLRRQLLHLRTPANVLQLHERTHGDSPTAAAQ